MRLDQSADYLRGLPGACSDATGTTEPPIVVTLPTLTTVERSGLRRRWDQWAMVLPARVGRS